MVSNLTNLLLKSKVHKTILVVVCALKQPTDPLVTLRPLREPPDPGGSLLNLRVAFRIFGVTLEPLG